MTRAVEAHLRGLPRACEVVGKDVVRRSLDLDGELAAIGRKPWVQVRSWLDRQRRLAAVLVDPYGYAGSSFFRTGGVYEMTSLRDGKGGHARVGAHEHAFRDRKRLPG